MDLTPVKVLIVDDHPSSCAILRDYFKSFRSISVCGVAFNGADAMEIIQRQKPDVVLLDIIMPELDGLSLLEQLNEASQKGLLTMPIVIILSSLNIETVTKKALHLGASYYLIKPYPLEHLLDCILMFSNSALCQTDPAEFSTPFNASITRYLIEIGMSTHIVGYRYCIQSLELLLAQNSYSPLMKCIYPIVAAKNNTTASCVESALRKAIATVSDPELRVLSNRSFLSRIAEHIRLSHDTPLSNSETRFYYYG